MDFEALDAHLQKLTPHQIKIIQVLYDSGSSWLTRSKVAKGLGKRRLTPYDINCLTMLSDLGILESSTQPTTAPGSDFAFIYHMPDAVADALQSWSEARENAENNKRRKPIKLAE
jgi:hypothetical protein